MYIVAFTFATLTYYAFLLTTNYALQIDLTSLDLSSSYLLMSSGMAGFPVQTAEGIVHLYSTESF